MYKGNIYEFVERIIKYMQETHGVRLTLELTDDWEVDRFKRRVGSEPRGWLKTGKKSLILWHYSDGREGRHGIGQTLYDREDFEEQVYNFVNERLQKMKKV